MTRRGPLVGALLAGLLLAAAPGRAEQAPRCAVVDVGARLAPAPVRAAVEAAVAGARRVQPLADPAMRGALRGEEPADHHLEPARAALAAAAAAYGGLKCDETITHASRAAELLEAEVGAAPVRAELQRALVYLFLCRDSRGDRAGAAEAAALLRGLGTAAPAAGPPPAPAGTPPAAAGAPPPSIDAPPPGVARDVWQRYPALPAAASLAVEIRSDPAGAHVLLDLRPVGQTPLQLSVAPGKHRLVVFRPGSAAWRRQVEIVRAGVVFDVSLAPAPVDPHAALRARVLALPAKAKGERAQEAVHLGREAGAARVLAFEVNGGKLRAQLFDAASGKARGAMFEAEAKAVTARPADLTVYLDGAGVATAAPATAPASRPSAPAKIGSKWWHWVIGAAAIAAVGVAIWQSQKTNDQVTIRVNVP